MASDPRRLEGPYLFVFADEERAPMPTMLPVVGRWNHIKAFVGSRKVPRVTGYLVPEAVAYLWMVESEEASAVMEPHNPWFIDHIRGNIVLCAAEYEPLTREMLAWIRAHLLRP